MHADLWLRQESDYIEVDSFVDLHDAKHMFELISHWKFEGTTMIFAGECKCL